jgi:hypothetical protein
MFYAEWSVDEDEFARRPEVADDLASLAQANPSLGYLIALEHVLWERAGGMPWYEYLAHRLGIGDWPDTSEDGNRVISAAKWDACADLDSKIVGPVTFSFDVSPDRQRASICVAGRRADGRFHVEVVKRGKGTGWIVGTIEELVRKHGRSTIVFDATAAGASLIAELEEKRIPFVAMNSVEHASAWGNFYDAVDQGTLRHLGDPVLALALAGATKRKLGDKWAWDRSNSTVDITPLVAATLGVGDVHSNRRGVSEVINVSELLSSSEDEVFDRAKVSAWAYK